MDPTGPSVNEPVGNRYAPSRPAARPHMSFETAEEVANAILYEGCYPYRASALKTRVRWQFGVVAPRALYDFPSIAPESCGALFDATGIDPGAARPDHDPRREA